MVASEVRFSSGKNDGIGGDEPPPPPTVSTNMIYDRPAGPVHIINGAGGNIEVQIFVLLFLLFPPID